MPKGKQTLSIHDPTQSAEVFAAALANVTALDNEKETVLGQAWLAGNNELITCGHVIGGHLDQLQNLVIKFPASGNRYSVQAIRLHPSFVRQSDQLVKFDAALLKIELRPPELGTPPLPLSFGTPLQAGQEVFAVRYPAHLERISAAPSPLSQKGQILGELRKHDNFHLLHDLALAQGDSGSPILIGNAVVAMHCGDTASLPGLNLPTTSIRLALWVDALRELNIAGAVEAQIKAPAKTSKRQYIALASAVVLASVATILVLFAFMFFENNGAGNWQSDNPAIKPIKVKLERTKNAANQDALRLMISPQSQCSIHALRSDGQNVKLLSPEPSTPLEPGKDLNLEINDQPQSITQFCVLAAAPSVNLDLEQFSKFKDGMPIKDFEKWLTELEHDQTGNVIHAFIPVQRSDQ